MRVQSFIKLKHLKKSDNISLHWATVFLISKLFSILWWVVAFKITVAELAALDLQTNNVAKNS